MLSIMLSLVMDGQADDYDDIARVHQYLELFWHWGDAYEIALSGRVLTARRRDGSGVLLFDESAEKLRRLMLSDYLTRPVRRHRMTSVPPEPQ